MRCTLLASGHEGACACLMCLPHVPVGTLRTLLAPGKLQPKLQEQLLDTLHKHPAMPALMPDMLVRACHGFEPITSRHANACLLRHVWLMMKRLRCVSDMRCVEAVTTERL
jgi:hypothetical protein